MSGEMIAPKKGKEVIEVRKEKKELLKKWLRGKQLSREEEYLVKKELITILERLREKSYPVILAARLQCDSPAVLKEPDVRAREAAREALEKYYKLLLILRAKGTQGDRVALWVLREASKFDELAASILEVARIKGHQHYYFCSSRCPRYVEPGTERESYDVPAWGPKGCPCDGIRQKYYFGWKTVNEKYKESIEDPDPEKFFFWGTLRDTLKELGITRGVWEIAVTTVTKEKEPKCISPYASYAPFLDSENSTGEVDGDPKVPDHFPEDIVYNPCSGEIYHSPEHGVE